MTRRIHLVAVTAVVTVFVAACSSGPAAPGVGTGERVCTESFCVTIPDGWVAEVGDTYISAFHELAPADTFLTAGIVNQRAIVESSGGEWPAPTVDVVRAFWSLLESAGVGEFERSQRLVGGAERSWGRHEDGEMWHLLVPTGATAAIGVEIRAPNDSWESHADAVFASVETDI